MLHQFQDNNKQAGVHAQALFFLFQTARSSSVSERKLTFWTCVQYIAGGSPTGRDLIRVRGGVQSPRRHHEHWVCTIHHSLLTVLLIIFCGFNNALHNSVNSICWTNSIWLMNYINLVGLVSFRVILGIFTSLPVTIVYYILLGLWIFCWMRACLARLIKKRAARRMCKIWNGHMMNWWLHTAQIDIQPCKGNVADATKKNPIRLPVC
jgi:hypothetical protein